MTVFVVQKPKPGPNGAIYDITPAQEFGTVNFIFDAYENPSSRPVAALEKVRATLADFDSAKDYVVAAGGDPYGLFLVGFVMNEIGAELKWLRFERIKQKPVPGKQQEQEGYYVEVALPKTVY